MGNNWINETIHALQQAGIPTRRGLPAGKIPYIDGAVAAVCIEKMEAALVTLAVHIFSPAALGGAACEDAALQASRAMVPLGGIYQIQAAEFDEKSSLFRMKVLVTFSRVYDLIE